MSTLAGPPGRVSGSRRAGRRKPWGERGARKLAMEMNDLVPPHVEPGGRSAAAHSWHWYAPRVAIGLFVVALLGSLWILHRQDAEENRSGLIRDVLWVEQNVEFSLDRDVEQMRQLAQDSNVAELDERQLEMRARHMLPGSPGLRRVVLLDRDGALRASAPPPGRIPPGGLWVEPDSDPEYRLARGTGKHTYTPTHLSNGEYQFDVFVPYYREGAFAGTVVGVYSVRSILAGLVPWWLAQKHRVTIRDASGNVLAAKSQVEAGGRPELTYQIPLDPPGHGLLLHVESYGSETRLLRNLLAVMILSLAGAVFWSLWSLRRHVQRRLATENALREEHAFRKAMEDSLETGMRAVDLEGRIVYVNPAFCKMLGRSESELIGHGPPQSYWPPEEREHIQAALAAARAAGAPRAGIELSLMRLNGERIDILLYEAPLIDARGRQSGWMGSVLDITERKQARERARLQEEKLAATARLVTMGEMASAIAHELNQPLAAIASYITGCQNVLEAGTSPGELKGTLQKTAQQAQRAGHIIRRVHEFVRKSEPARSAVRINAVVEEAVGFAEAEAHKRHVKIQPRLSPEDPELLADPLLLQQVLLNLLRNGMDAMADTPPERREILVTTELSGSTVTVDVVDHGCGLSPEVQERLFDPFFSTKAEGMGMGLNICRSIMELHRGRVWAEPNAGGGTVFSFSLPVERCGSPQ
jgi:two-component system sensor histidine kinase DctS